MPPPEPLGKRMQKAWPLVQKQVLPDPARLDARLAQALTASGDAAETDHQSRGAAAIPEPPAPAQAQNTAQAQHRKAKAHASRHISLNRNSYHDLLKVLAPAVDPGIDERHCDNRDNYPFDLLAGHGQRLFPRSNRGFRPHRPCTAA